MIDRQMIDPYTKCLMIIHELWKQLEINNDLEKKIDKIFSDGVRSVTKEIK